jgi:monofunctional biosynthetic peptidoglycan transglycosylase
MTCLLILSICLVVGLRWVNPPTSAFMLARALSSDQPVHYHWRDWELISEDMALAVIASEDQRFPTHAGFDFKQLKAALEDYRKGKGLRGASTISQQTAKNIFLWTKKSFFRKGLEAWFTLWMEVFLSKQRILEVYLNIAEFGEGIYGVGAASQLYFDKTSDAINRYEAALLAAVLPNPKRYKVNNPSDFVSQRQRWILVQMKQLGPTTVQHLE